MDQSWVTLHTPHQTRVVVSVSPVWSLQRFPTDRAYFIAKELLTTERTYVKDLEVVTVVRAAKILPPSSSGLFSRTLSPGGEIIDYSG